MIVPPTNVRVWLANGHTDMRRGMNGLALQVQQSLQRDPHAGDLYVFRGRRGDLLKILWHDGLGMSLYAKRLERGRFLWPSPADGCVAITGRRGRCGQDHHSGGLHPRAPGPASVSRAPAPGTRRHPCACCLCLLRWHPAVQARGGRRRNLGSRASQLEGHSACAREVLLSRLRAHQPATRAIPRDPARLGGAEPSCDDAVREVRPAPAAQSPSRALRP